MHRLTGLVTVTVGLTATAAGVGNGPASQIAQTGELLGEFGSARFQILDGVGHQGGLHYPSVLHTQGLRAQKKKTALRATSVSHTRRLRCNLWLPIPYASCGTPARITI